MNRAALLLAVFLAVAYLVLNAQSISSNEKTISGVVVDEHIDYTRDFSAKLQEQQQPVYKDKEVAAIQKLLETADQFKDPEIAKALKNVFASLKAKEQQQAVVDRITLEDEEDLPLN